MPCETRVHSSDTQVFLDGVGITGLQSKGVTIDINNQDLRNLGSLSNSDKIITADQTVNVDLSYLIIAESFNPFTGNLLNIDKQEIIIKDTTEELTISDCYLDSINLNFSVGEIPSCSISYLADSVSYDDDVSVILEKSIDQTNHQNSEIFRPQEVFVSGDGTGGIDSKNGCFCFQSISIQVSLQREPVKRVGQLSPIMRYPTLPINGQITFEGLKTQMKDVDYSPLVLEKETLTFSLESKGLQKAQDYEIRDCSLVSYSQNQDLDGNATLGFTYEFPVNNTGISLTNRIL